jgi:hypothetical protein
MFHCQCLSYHGKLAYTLVFAVIAAEILNFFYSFPAFFSHWPFFDPFLFPSIHFSFSTVPFIRSLPFILFFFISFTFHSFFFTFCSFHPPSVLIPFSSIPYPFYPLFFFVPFPFHPFSFAISFPFYSLALPCPFFFIPSPYHSLTFSSLSF